MPNFQDATLDQARSIAVDFELEVEEVYSNSVQQGRIVSQDPAPGTELEVGSTVTVRVSRGPEMVSIPSLGGEPRDAAVSRLRDLGFSVDETQEASRNIPEGQVIRTEPSSGQARRGSTVTVVVSRGDVVRVPDVFRQPLNQAVQRLQDAGLQVGTQSAQSCEFIQSQDPEFNCDTFPDQHVVSATLQWNAWVPRGSTVDIAYYDAEAD